jgi:hypothetical protein
VSIAEVTAAVTTEVLKRLSAQALTTHSPSHSSSSLALPSLSPASLAQANAMPGAVHSPGQALALAHHSATQGIPSLQFSLVPEAFLPAVLPTAISSKLDAGEYFEFELALKLIYPRGNSRSGEPIESKEVTVVETKGQKLRFLGDWLLVFSSCLLWLADHKPAPLRDWLAYQKCFVSLSVSHGFAIAYDYDIRNRDYSCRANAPLAIFKHDLWLPSVSTGSLAYSASRAKRGSSQTTSGSAKKAKFSPRFVDNVEICYLFNLGRCRNPCPNGRAHACWLCSKSHARSDCPSANSSSKTSVKSENKDPQGSSKTA